MAWEPYWWRARAVYFFCLATPFEKFHFPLENIYLMPTISMFYGIIIRMYFAPGEHPPPHFHVYYAEHKAIVDIGTCEISEGTLPRKQEKLVLAWAELHRDEWISLAPTRRRGSPIGGAPAPFISSAWQPLSRSSISHSRIFTSCPPYRCSTESSSACTSPQASIRLRIFMCTTRNIRPSSTSGRVKYRKGLCRENRKNSFLPGPNCIGMNGFVYFPLSFADRSSFNGIGFA